ncbi:hypothetical protein Gbem_2370 [Citrifermentans bemidjiense Bem]|uniref:Uncharacterized protein n=1 Tax=Citrifermentans bemidjiense (strain ATCC BAA-1014 / DSM 16622 / JCM 12645 / Bem) TaxID=404380 RepID=B5EF73_CITBB|nr:hypothetical protein Gbem_2370 [Citrifermentans bemidjiense Bem]
MNIHFGGLSRNMLMKIFLFLIALTWGGIIVVASFRRK